MNAFIGQIIQWPIGYVPEGWLRCDGSTRQILQYQALAAILGNTYGGDGKTTFGLPNLIGKAPVGYDSRNVGAYGINKSGGAESVKITAAQFPIHTHQATASVDITNLTVTVNGTPYNNNPGDTNIPAQNTCLANATTSASDDSNIYNTNAPTSGKNMYSPGAATISGNIGVNVALQPIMPKGDQASTSIIQPYVVVDYIINWDGEFPQLQD